MQCSKCKQEAIHFQPYSGQYLCREHLVADIESKAKRTIRQHNGMRPGDDIAVILRGDAADMALLFFLQKLTGKRRDIRVSGIPAGRHGIPLADAKNAGATRIALATTLEDAAAAILAGILQGNPETCISQGPGDTEMLPVITPFCHIPYREIALYAQVCGLGGSSIPATGECETLYTDVKRLLGDYTRLHPAAPHAILNLCELVNDAERETTGSESGQGTEQLMKKPGNT
jgi:tRNA(Ile)-lysidine synthase TilS/MesJ